MSPQILLSQINKKVTPFKSKKLNKRKIDDLYNRAVELANNPRVKKEVRQHLYAAADHLFMAVVDTWEV